MVIDQLLLFVPKRVNSPLNPPVEFAHMTMNKNNMNNEVNIKCPEPIHGIFDLSVSENDFPSMKLESACSTENSFLPSFAIAFTMVEIVSVRNGSKIGKESIK
tara:strand:+ start:763 stop:1071 length:309 start_codon:yes stop_codon:yes gene_type:complete